MPYCSSCGSDIPEGQGSSCSMCYGDIGYGRDGYYEAWTRKQDPWDVGQCPICGHEAIYWQGCLAECSKCDNCNAID